MRARSQRNSYDASRPTRDSQGSFSKRGGKGKPSLRRDGAGNEYDSPYKSSTGGRRDRGGRPDFGARSDRGARPERIRRGEGSRFASDDRRPRQRFDAEPAADEFVIGRRAIIEALKGGRSLNKLLVQEQAEGGSLGEILALAREHGVVVQRVPRVKLDEVAQNRSHQGVLAYVAAKSYVELDDLIIKAKAKKPGLLIVLDGLEDPHNLGSVMRSVDGSGATGVIIPKRRAVPLTGTVAKASAGALEYVDVARVGNVNQALARLKEAGFWIVGADERAQQMYYEADLTLPTVIVIGNEGTGIAKLTQNVCDMLVKLPMEGQVNSLNAGVAAGILLYEAVRQRTK